jgi:hypothetical protein
MFIPIDVQAEYGRYDFNNEFTVSFCELRAGWNLNALNLKSDSNEGKQTWTLL